MPSLMKERVTSTSSGQMHKPPEWLVRAVRVHTLSPFGRSENVLETFPAISMWPSGPSQFDAYNSGMSRRTEKVFISLLGGQAHLQFAASASTFELESCAPHTARQTVSVGISSDVQSHARVAGKAGQRRDEDIMPAPCRVVTLETLMCTTRKPLGPCRYTRGV